MSDPTLQAELAEKGCDDKMSVREFEKLVKTRTFLRIAVIVHKLAYSARYFYRVQILALNIFYKRKLVYCST